MSEIDWNLVGAELNAMAAPKRISDREAPQQSETDLLKHIEDALRMDMTLSHRADAPR